MNWASDASVSRQHDSLKPIFVIVLILAVLIGSFAGLSTLETIHVRGIAVDRLQNPVAGLPLGIFIDGVKVGLVYTSNADKGTNFHIEFPNAFGFASTFPGDLVILDLGTLDISSVSNISLYGHSISLVPNSDSSELLETPTYLNSRNLNLLAVVFGCGLTSLLTAVYIQRIEPKVTNEIKVKLPRYERGTMNPLSPVLLNFLIEVGRFSMKYLNKKAVLKRKDAPSNTEIDLTNEAQVREQKAEFELSTSSLTRPQAETLKDHLEKLQNELFLYPILEAEIDEDHKKGMPGDTAARRRNQLRQDRFKTQQRIADVLLQLGYTIDERPASQDEND